MSDRTEQDLRKRAEALRRRYGITDAEKRRRMREAGAYLDRAKQAEAVRSQVPKGSRVEKEIAQSIGRDLDAFEDITTTGHRRQARASVRRAQLATVGTVEIRSWR